MNARWVAGEEVGHTLDLGGADVELLEEKCWTDQYGAAGRFEVVTRMIEDALGRIRYFALMLDEVTEGGREPLYRWDVSHLHLHVHEYMLNGPDGPPRSMMALDRVEQIKKAYEVAYQDMLQVLATLDE